VIDLDDLLLFWRALASEPHTAERWCGRRGDLGARRGSV
jgi:hypothetical protein